MIVITGAVGFIGSCLLRALNNLGIYNIILVDDFSFYKKNKNIAKKKYVSKIDRLEYIDWFKNNKEKIKKVYHLGARTDTTEKNINILNKLNLEYSKKLWKICTDNKIPLIYASSAACYGDGEFGFDDCHKFVKKLRPLNPYGESKNSFDKWVLSQKKSPPFWAGFRFFNVYGPNEFHKGKMASVIYNFFKQLKSTSQINLFKSHNLAYQDGNQARDFVYVKDVVDVLIFMMQNQRNNGIYNIGTGVARTYNDLADIMFSEMKLIKEIKYIDTPKEIKKQYQYFTEAKINKLRLAGYEKNFFSIEEGVKDYVSNYLLQERYF